MSLLTRVATALLDAAGESALAGDLLEERRSGRSSFWYGRQVTSALWHVTIRETRTHAFHTFCAIALGWIVLQLTDAQLPFSTRHFTLSRDINGWMRAAHLAWEFTALRYFVAGWVVSRLFASTGRHFAMVGALTLFFALRAVVESGLMLWFSSIGLRPPLLLVSRSVLIVDVLLAVVLPIVTLAGGLVLSPRQGNAGGVTTGRSS
jgi:hypothetical protein